MVSLGLKSERMAKFIPTAVPSVHANLSDCPVPRSRDTRLPQARYCHDVDRRLTAGDHGQCDTGDQPLPTSTSDAGTQVYQAGFSLLG
ncbi:hypothetical protein AALO_G00052660 [Alosa alosa]|uniref:Uncharacterized protein n=1 Tax=Alosa alosa TaxID=278164 RepID=A0AAV6H491_9TELE|nr:hypothetical protein AALO_G00052660 [Alosa alosa]